MWPSRWPPFPRPEPPRPAEGLRPKRPRTKGTPDVKKGCALAIAAMLVAGSFASAAAQEPAHDVNQLAKETQNPVSSLISVPFQFNFNSGGDLEDQTFFNLNFQPVIPFKASPNWNVIARTIVPINSFPGP